MTKSGALDTDTIAAIATPTGRSAVAVIRVSGSGVKALAEKLIGETIKVRDYRLRSIRDARGMIDHAMVFFAEAPNTFTGEDYLELHTHGGASVPKLALQACLDAGARLARPGEFTERAYLNDKIDLLQAEAIADLIDAASSRAARSAIRTLSGAFSEKVQTFQNELTELRVELESEIDFPDEEIDNATKLADRIRTLTRELTDLREKAVNGHRLSAGLTIAIVGPPNVGKSSLLNALTGSERAIVTDIAGTTRDLVELQMDVNGVAVTFIDTAGLRETADPIEREGIKRAIKSAEDADVVFSLAAPGIADTPYVGSESIESSQRVVRLWNKSDLAAPPSPEFDYTVSAQSGAGIDELMTSIMSSMTTFDFSEDSFAARQRHVEALDRSVEIVNRINDGVGSLPSELVANDLRELQQELSKITGEFSADDLLGVIFSEFCIGK